jgi:hypothetical protein
VDCIERSEELTKVLKLRNLASVFILVSLLALVIPIVLPANAQEEWPCAYTGFAFFSSDDSNPVPAGTGIQALEDSTVLGTTTTGTGGMADHEFYLDGINAEIGTVVHFQVFNGVDWVPVVETAVHGPGNFCRIEINLHAGVGEEWPCAYTGHAFMSGDDSNPVPAGTGIRILEDSTVLGETTTGLWQLDDNEFYLDGVFTELETVVHFQVFDGVDWVPAVETAVHGPGSFCRVEIDLHTGVETLHINSRQSFIFCYPGPDCALPEALTNIGPDGEDCASTIWGQENWEGDEAVEWCSYDAALGAGFLGDFDLHTGQAYVLTHDNCYCIEWEMCN